ncbi:NanQ anomerase/TabA/YiaL family protein [Flavitalea sp.]|nr:YhcH/YjgK/YiaL family protein [Flavitalea sp.]
MKIAIKQYYFLQVFTATVFLLTVCSSCGSGENDKTETVVSNGNEAKLWFEGKTWLNGLQRIPNETIDYQEFKKEYDSNPEAWNKAFQYLKNTDLAALETGKYPIDGDNVFALVTKGATKSQDTAAWESHHRHADIHWMIAGKEKIGITIVDSLAVKTPYDSTKDIGFYTGTGNFQVADSSNFLIIVSPVAHCPGVAIEGYPEVKKVVIKIKKSL